MAEINSFIFYRSYLDALETLSEREQLILFKAIAYKSLDGEEIELEGATKGMFSLIVPQIEANRKRYQNGLKGAEYGNRGGRPKNSSETLIEPQENPKTTPNLNLNENQNQNQNGNVFLPVECFELNQPERSVVSIHEEPKSRRKKVSSLSKEQQTRFDRFWEVYPRRISIGDAEKTWNRIDPDDGLADKIVKAVEVAKINDNRFKDIKFTPHPASWLNQRGWENELKGDKIDGIAANCSNFRASSGFKNQL